MQFLKLNEAVEQIKNNSLITYSGMQLNRAPMALLYEIVRQNKKNLDIVSIPNPFAADLLIGAGCIKNAKLGFNGFSFEDGFVISPNFRKAVENKKIKLYETDIFEILQGLKASALGLKEIEVPGFKNTDHIKVNKNKETENGIITKAIKPDFALIHAQAADEKGNVFIEDPLIENLLVKASKNIIVTVEKISKIKKITIAKSQRDLGMKMTKQKIKTIEELKEIIENLKNQNKIIITTNGVFDILHLGHVKYLQEAKKLGDVLIVAINSDSSTKQIKGPKRPINNQEERAKVLSALEFVDYIVIFNETDPIKILSEIKPNTHVKGGDYNINQIIEKEIVEKNNGRIVLIPEIKGFSTTDLINKIIKNY